MQQKNNDKYLLNTMRQLCASHSQQCRIVFHAEITAKEKTIFSFDVTWRCCTKRCASI